MENTIVLYANVVSKTDKEYSEAAMEALKIKERKVLQKMWY